MKPVLFFLCVCAPALIPSALAQPALAPGPAIVPYRPRYDELKAFLNLDDDQVKQLQQVQQERTLASQAAYAQINQKQKQLNDMLNGSSPDPLAIGNLNIELNRMRSQLANTAPIGLKDSALAVLNSTQRDRLQNLQDALNLRQAADQAAALNLINYAAHAPIMPMGVPAK